MQLKTTATGGKYYEELSEGFREASMEDFYNHNGKLILNKAYLVKSIKTPNCYWANRVKIGFPFPGSDFKIFMDNGYVFVRDREG